MYIDEDESGDKTLIVCQAKYGDNISNDILVSAANKMVATYKNLNASKHGEMYGDTLKNVFRGFQGKYDTVQFVIFCKKKLNKSTISSAIKNINTTKSVKGDELQVFDGECIITEMKKYQEQPAFVLHDSIDKSSYKDNGNALHCRDVDNGIVINAKASSLNKLYNKYKNEWSCFSGN